MKKIICFGLLAIVLSAIICNVVYVANGKSVRRTAVTDYLKSRGYETHEIHELKVYYQPFNYILGYKVWDVSVEFADELTALYFYEVADGVVTQSGFGGGKGLSYEEKGQYRHAENPK